MAVELRKKSIVFFLADSSRVAAWAAVLQRHLAMESVGVDRSTSAKRNEGRLDRYYDTASLALFSLSLSLCHSLSLSLSLSANLSVRPSVCLSVCPWLGRSLFESPTNNQRGRPVNKIEKKRPAASLSCHLTGHILETNLEPNRKDFDRPWLRRKVGFFFCVGRVNWKRLR